MSTSERTGEVGTLYGPQTIDTIIEKPEFSFLSRYYNLLYQRFIPNCNLTIATLRQHCHIPTNAESHILNGSNRRNCCQRLLEYLLIQLDSHRDYMQFCYYLTIVSIVTNLPFKLVAEFRTNGYWRDNLPVHPKLVPTKLQSMKSETDDHMFTCASTVCDCGNSDSYVSENSAAQVEDDDDLAVKLNHDNYDNDYCCTCDVSDDRGCTVVCRVPVAWQDKHMVLYTDNQSANLGAPNHLTDNRMVASSSTGLTEESNGTLENDDSV